MSVQNLSNETMRNEIPSFLMGNYHDDLSEFQQNLENAGCPTPLIDLITMTNQIAVLNEHIDYRSNTMFAPESPLFQEFFAFEEVDSYTESGKAIDRRDLPVPIRQDVKSHLIDTLEDVRMSIPQLFPDYQAIATWDRSVDKPLAAKIIGLFDRDSAIESLAKSNRLENVHKMSIVIDSILDTPGQQITRKNLTKLRSAAQKECWRQEWIPRDALFLYDRMAKICNDELLRQRYSKDPEAMSKLFPVLLDYYKKQHAAPPLQKAA